MSDPCGMRDHGRLLAAAALRRRDLTVDEHWLVNDGTHLGPAVAASWRLLRWARQPAPGSTVVWHYSSFGFGWRGVPLFGVCLGLALRGRRIRVVTFLHEPALPWNRRLDRRAVTSLGQWLALRAALAGSSVVVATTDQRAARLRARDRPPPGPERPPEAGARHPGVLQHPRGRRAAPREPAVGLGEMIRRSRSASSAT